MWQTSSAKNRLAGMSLEIMPIGTTFVKIASTGELFSWNKPPSYVRNLVAGTKYVEIIGKMEIQNETNGDTCTLTFKEASWGGGGRNAVSSVVSPSPISARQSTDHHIPLHSQRSCHYQGRQESCLDRRKVGLCARGWSAILLNILLCSDH